MLYFDHNATTPVAPEVADAYLAALRDIPGNASSMHRSGQVARQHLENARHVLARRMSILPNELVFTSCGSESNNLAIFGLLRELSPRPKHVITTAIEHPSVLEPFRQLEREGVSVTWLTVAIDGAVHPYQIESAIRPETALVSVMHANNETGVIQPLREIANVIARVRARGQRIFFHSDGVQALGKIPVNVAELGLDLYSVSAHKVSGPKGIGALFARKSVPLSGITLGGRQERARRAGTENVPGAIAFARALELDHFHSAAMRDYFEREVLAELDDVEVNGAGSQRLPNTSNLLFRGLPGEALLIALDRHGIAVSTGSACSSGSVEPSHVLLAMGRSVAEARSSVRFSFGPSNSPDDVDTLIRAVISCTNRMRAGKPRKAQLVS